MGTGAQQAQADRRATGIDERTAAQTAAARTGGGRAETRPALKRQIRRLRNLQKNERASARSVYEK